MKVFIEVPGDIDAGIRDHTVTISGFPEPNIDSEREDDRLLLTQCFAEIYTQAVGVRFDDECPDCGTRLPNHDCSYMRTQ